MVSTWRGCSAVLAAAYPELGIGFVKCNTFGLTVLTMAYAIGRYQDA
jgi:hypothetical protein